MKVRDISRSSSNLTEFLLKTGRVVRYHLGMFRVGSGRSYMRNLVSYQEFSDIEGRKFWLNLLKNILVKIGPCKDE